MFFLNPPLWRIFLLERELSFKDIFSKGVEIKNPFHF